MSTDDKAAGFGHRRHHVGAGDYSQPRPVDYAQTKTATMSYVWSLASKGIRVNGVHLGRFGRRCR